MFVLLPFLFNETPLILTECLNIRYKTRITINGKGIRCVDSFDVIQEYSHFNLTIFNSLIKRKLEVTMWPNMLLTLVNISQCDYYQDIMKCVRMYIIRSSYKRS